MLLKLPLEVLHVVWRADDLTDAARVVDVLHRTATLAQTRQVFANLGKVLEAVGASFSNVVELTTYLVGRESVQPFIQARTEIFPGIFPDGDFPPNTLLIIDGLVRPEFLVEIKAVAALE